jgi:hypothetical protein
MNFCTTYLVYLEKLIAFYQSLKMRDSKVTVAFLRSTEVFVGYVNEFLRSDSAFMGL